VKVRGIYSTALTKFFIDNGIEVVDPSETVNERFDLNCESNSADVLVYDKEDMNGITVNGSGSERIATILQSYFYDTAVKKIETGAIYAGRIKRIDTRQNNLYVDLGNGEEGILSLHDYWGFLREGEKLLVQVKGMVRGMKLLSTKLRLFGENTILIKDGFTKVSKHIRNQAERQRLTRIAGSVKIEGWGILWKSHATGKTDAELVTEINKLAEKEKALKAEFNDSGPRMLESGTSMHIIDFGSLSKQGLDKLRSSVTLTIPGHHFLKSGGYTVLTDFAEALEKPDEFVVARINSVLKADGPRPGMTYEIVHKKPGSRDLTFRGTVEESSEDKIVIRRKLVPGGRLDGIGASINDGDYALTTFRPNSWYVVHKYFGKDGFKKGVYVNINTPVEVYPRFARYIDLEVDVVERNDKLELIDVEKLQHISAAGIVKKELADRALEVANHILKGGFENDKREL
jgi:hypothetical protein